MLPSVADSMSVDPYVHSSPTLDLGSCRVALIPAMPDRYGQIPESTPGSSDYCVQQLQSWPDGWTTVTARPLTMEAAGLTAQRYRREDQLRQEEYAATMQRRQMQQAAQIPSRDPNTSRGSQRTTTPSRRFSARHVTGHANPSVGRPHGGLYFFRTQDASGNYSSR